MVWGITLPPGGICRVSGAPVRRGLLHGFQSQFLYDGQLYKRTTLLGKYLLDRSASGISVLAIKWPLLDSFQTEFRRFLLIA
jgi:hypothetical protein